MARTLIKPATKEETPKIRTAVIPHDAANEATILAAAVTDPKVLDKLSTRVRADHFVSASHRTVWSALLEIHRRKLSYSREAVTQLAGAQAGTYLDELARAKPGVVTNLEFHLTMLFWDSARVLAAKNSIPSFLDALRDSRADPARVRALARAVADSLEGHGDKKHLLDPDELVRAQMLEIESRVTGRAIYPYGIEGLDTWPEGTMDEKGRDVSGQARMIPGTAPGQITVVSALSGGGKSTYTANIVLGLLKQKRRVLFGAWEMTGGMSLELLACISLGWSRSDLIQGRGPIAAHEGRVQIQEKMHEISKYVRFLGNPFRRRRGEKGGNDRNLDLVHSHIKDSGCEVFVADLWKRCLVDTAPDAEEDALIQQQAMAEETKVHCILLQQQRLKDIEQRPDKRPTREGIKGSGAWVEVADTILGVHRPFLFKRVEDNKLEVFVLKQRYGKWPLGIEHDWSADHGAVDGGKSIEYDRPGEGNDMDDYFDPKRGKKGKR